MRRLPPSQGMMGVAIVGSKASFTLAPPVQVGRDLGWAHRRDLWVRRSSRVFHHPTRSPCSFFWGSGGGVHLHGLVPGLIQCAIGGLVGGLAGLPSHSGFISNCRQLSRSLVSASEQLGEQIDGGGCVCLALAGSGGR